ncbi:ABC transporter family substrate-binding protein [Pseudarthrobacter sp. J75]|uniref:ABC transporter family substrate-binding protein n=1 Tax=unclassified Pseudarthrobacter TaxID=2647000 RepID=UPI002E8213AF|nr:MULTISPECIES: ABC transporter family substrate-binding protein [unclassified Pseudarthrobacter]MEE2521272.1 ABC transporter family substrate-binding protein [Pseudarthrobacter sp. J47]MEE2528504.1 ABC transporter family substrate-binding protein [Pseudarthrobacter sp. J75]
MRWSRIGRLLTALCVAVLAVTGCSPDTPGVPTGEETKSGGSVTVMEMNALSSFNPASAAGNTDINVKIGHLTHSGFFTIDNSAKVVRNEKFGRYERVSEDPLRVRYSVNEGVQWSDGDPVDAGDLLLAWAAGSGYFDDVDPVAGTGSRYFAAAADTTGLRSTSFPELGGDGRSITLTYASGFADWETAFDVGMPAHVVALKSGLADEPALIDLFEGLPKGDPVRPAPKPELERVAGFWNSGFESTTLPEDTSLYLSSGPFVVQEVTPGVSVRLVRNRAFDWGPEPFLDEITIRFAGSAGAAGQALATGQADMATVPLAAAGEFRDLGPDSVTVTEFDRFAYEHLDLTFAGVFADEKVRQAFLKTVPRQDIAEAALGAGASLQDSFVFYPSAAKYVETVAANGSDAYSEPDVDGARSLLAGATPTVRILYNRDNPDRARAFELIQGSAARAGFNVVDGGLAAGEWGAALGRGSHDAAISGWIGTGVGVSHLPQVFRSGAGSNFTGFANRNVDRLLEEAVRQGDQAERDTLLAEADAEIWRSAYGVPLYQARGVNARVNRLGGVVPGSGPLGVWWNVSEWHLERAGGR